MPNIPQVPTILSYTLVQPGGIHTAQVEYSMAQRTQALWYRCRGNSFSFGWPHPTVAPRYSSASINTWGSFDFDETNDTYTLSLPWTMQEHAERIGAHIWFAVSQQESVQLRLKTDDLTDVVASTTGEASQPTNPLSISRTPPGNWSQNDLQSFFDTTCEITPTLPASRRITVTVECQNRILSGDYRTLSGTVQVYLHSMVLWDIFPAIGS